MGRISNVYLFLLITVLNTASSQILIPSNVAEGLKFTINCDANKVTIPDPNIQNILGLFIIRTTSQDNNKPIANYYVNPPPGVKPNGTELPGRNYTFSPTGAGTGTNNRATMKIQLDIDSALCSDAGEYRCDVQYYYGMYKTASYSQNLTVETGVSNLILKPDPDFETAEVPKESLYPEGTNVALTCSFYGPNNTKVSWRVSTWDPNRLEDYPTANDISGSNPELQGGSTGCPKYFIKSMLNLAITSNTVKTTYYCIISDSKNQELGRDNYTIGTTETIVPQLQQPILSMSPLIDGESYTITCDASRVVFPDVDTAATSVSELAIETMLGTSQNYTKIAQYLSCGPSGNLEYKNLPTGRDWDISFVGSRNGINNKWSMKIEIHVRDTTVSDAGIYRCRVRYYGAQGGMSELYQEQVVTAQMSVPQPVINVQSYPERGIFTVTCNARRVSIPRGKSNPAVRSLEVHAMLGSLGNYIKVAEYLACGPQDKLQFQNPPAGRDWVYTFSGANNGVDNRWTMTIEIQVQNASCTDAGRYMCSVSYYSSDSGTVTLQQDQNVSSTCT